MRASSLITIIFLSGITLVTGARAHDTWLSPKQWPAQIRFRPHELLVYPGTGDFFPRPDFQTPLERVNNARCQHGEQTVQTSLDVHNKLGFQLQHRFTTAQPAVSCAVQLHTQSIELDDTAANTHVEEARASALVRKQWAGLQAQKAPWTETYTKTAKMDLGPVFSSHPMNSAMELVANTPDQHTQVGSQLTLKLTLQGKPLADQPVQWINGSTDSQGWINSDAQGLIRVPLTETGRWMIRTIHIEALANPQPNSAYFSTQFYTHTFWVRP